MDAPIVVTLRPSLPTTKYTRYQIAGQVILLDVPLVPLFAFLVGPQTWRPTHHADGGAETAFYDAVMPIVQRLRRVRCWQSERCIRVAIDGVGEYRIDKESQAILQTECVLQDETLLAEALLGPPLMLALALRGIFCLHASGIEYQQAAILFVGESGRGKSTLARCLNAQYPETLQRFADDIVPLASARQCSVGRAVRWDALPDFPQLKLSNDEQGAFVKAAPLPIRAICVLGSPSEVIGAERLSAAQAMLTMTRHTVAARILTPALIRQQMTHYARLSVPAFRLRYPRTFDIFPQIRQVIETLPGP